MLTFFCYKNIVKSLHSKINKSISTYKKLTNTNFIIAIRNILYDNEIKKNEIERKDFITKTLIENTKTIKK